MLPLLVVLLLILLLFGVGVAVHFLWFAALVLVVLWAAGFAVGRGRSGRWWYW